MDQRLHRLFRPLQANGRVPFYRYVEAAPSPALKPYVACYWASEPAPGPAARMHSSGTIDRVLPDGCTDIIFEHDPLHGVCRATYCGSFDRPFTIEYDPHRPVRKFGVRFFPGGAHCLLQLPLAEFANGDVPLDQLSAGFPRELAEAVAQAPTLAAKILTAERSLLAHLQAHPPVDDPVMKNVMHRIFVSGGQLPVSDLAAAEAVSSRHMNRKFERWIGVSPKRFSEIVRFQTALGAIAAQTTRRSPDSSALAADCGFFDQAAFD